MGQNSQNLLEMFGKKVVKRLKNWEKIFPVIFGNAAFDQSRIK